MTAKSQDFVPEVVQRTRVIVDDRPAAALTAVPRTCRVAPETDSNWQLALFLEHAVPLRMWELHTLPIDRLIWLSKPLVPVLSGPGSEGFRFHMKGKSGPAAVALASGIAMLALVTDGGVTFAGLHWCVPQPCPMCPDWVDPDV